jgi:glycosyltransferase involved in cell wall biosynthesis
MSSSGPRASLIIATYEMPRHLNLVCAALARQSMADFEIFFCDDGSGPETTGIIREFAGSVRVPVKHLWQEHEGFRKCRILNRALREAQGETLVFLDGDCIPHRDYVRDHVENQEEGRYLAGRRVELGKDFSQRLTPALVRRGFFDRPRLSLFLDSWAGESEHFQRTLRIRSAWLRQKLKMDRIDDLKGCNYSVSRKDLLAINGFDEDYEGYGREDTDVELRLQNLGLRIKSLKGLALQYHVWHPRREFTPANDGRLDEVKRSGRVRCQRGLEQSGSPA